MKSLILVFALIALTLAQSDIQFLRQQLINSKNNTNGTVCSKLNETCGHEAGSKQCCDKLQCVKTFSIFGTSGKCVNVTQINVTQPNNTKTCSAEGQVCGHEQTHEKCCEGFECQQITAIFGGKGKCVKRQNNQTGQVCAKINETCGHEFGQTRCCQGFSCVSQAGLKGGQGKCVQQTTVNVTKNNTCAKSGETCGHEFLQNRCCEGFQCQTSGLHGGQGKCVAVNQTQNNTNANKTNTCAKTGDTCGHEFLQNRCCDGLQCQTNGLHGGQGKCVAANQTQNVCSKVGDECSHERGLKQCCDSLRCVTSGIPGSKGKCQANNSTQQNNKTNTTNNTLCATFGDICGNNSTQKCCDGFVCVKTGSEVGAISKCRKLLSNQTQTVCGKLNEVCQHDKGQQCCEGFQCVKVFPYLGASGRCIKKN